MVMGCSWLADSHIGCRVAADQSYSRGMPAATAGDALREQRTLRANRMQIAHRPSFLRDQFARGLRCIAAGLRVESARGWRGQKVELHHGDGHSECSRPSSWRPAARLPTRTMALCTLSCGRTAVSPGG